MAYLFKKPQSRYWFLKYRDLDTGRWREKSTKCLFDDPKETRRAQRMAETASAKEAQVGPLTDGEFAAWVPDYITNHYSKSPKSLKRYRLAWSRIDEWCRIRKVRHPAALRYEHAKDYMAWRIGDGSSHNTARLELKFFSFILQEAMRREYADKNPLALAKILRDAPAEKKELSLADFAAGRKAFQERKSAPWMLTVFEICAHLGCRFNEAEFGAEDVDFERKLVWLTDSKRKATDPRKRFCVPMPETLAEHLKIVLKDGKRTAPPLTESGEHNRQFNITLKKATGATSHSLRVSFITRCHRAGLSESQAMRLVNHSTRMVHAIYSKLSVDDAMTAAAKVPPPVPLEIPAPTSLSSSDRKTDTPSS